jgi:hypothetical protein
MTIDSLLEFIEKYKKLYPECETVDEFVKKLVEHRDLEKIMTSLDDRTGDNQTVPEWYNKFMERLREDPQKQKTWHQYDNIYRKLI